VVWISKHGNEKATGNDQYPNVPIKTKQSFWSSIESMFQGLLLDTTVSSVNETTLSQLVDRNHRLVVWASDYVETTNTSRYALDGARIDNPCDDSISSVTQQMKDFEAGAAKRVAHKAEGRFYLYSFANSQPGDAIGDAAKLFFLNEPAINVMKTREDCAAAYKIANMTSWCPTDLLDTSQLSNYYAQVPIWSAYMNKTWDLPNAIYIDAVDTVGGTIRTGTKRVNQSPTDPTCDVFKYTHCSTDQAKCDDGWTANGDKEHFTAFDSDGTKHGFCGLAGRTITSVVAILSRVRTLRASLMSMY